MIIHEVGIFLGVHRYDFPDKKTGKPVQIAFVKLASPSKTNKVFGLSDEKYPINFEDFDLFTGQAKGLSGKQVSLEVDVSFIGRYNRRRAISIQPFVLKQGA